jgi:hypothetical protein
LPHSNFHPELQISNDGSVIKLAGPIEPEDDDDELAGIAIWAVVTQEPAERDAAKVQQGATGAGTFELDHAGLRLASDWECSADTQGGNFREDWAFATAEMLERNKDGAVEQYTWSQWVWLRRHP